MKKNVAVLFGLLLALAVAQNVRAQADAITVPNPGRIHSGDIGALEGGAMVARANDGSASWYNPAGLIRAIRPSVSGNASLYEFNRVTVGSGKEAEDATNMNIVPAYIGSNGFFGDNRSLAWGFSINTPLAWKSIASSEEESGTAGIDLLYDRYKSAAELKAVVPTFAMAYAVNDTFSVGASAHLIYTTEYQSGSQYYRDDLNSTLFVYNYAYTQDSENLQGQLALGASWRPVESVNLGVVVKSPSLNIYDNTNYSYDSIFSYDDGTGKIVTDSEYETNSNLDYHYKRPAEISVGLALVQPTFGFEADATYRMKVDPYNQYQGKITTNAVTSSDLLTGSFGVSSDTFGAPELAETSVVNYRVGGYLALNDAFKWHLGAFTDKSTLKNSEMYQMVDLYGATTGISYTDKNSSLGVGVAYSWSDGMKVETYDPTIGDSVEKSAKIQSLGFILSGKYYF